MDEVDWLSCSRELMVMWCDWHERRFIHDSVRFCADVGRGGEFCLGPVWESPPAGSASFKRLVQVATAIASSPDHSLPKVCDDWGDLKAAYRFLSNSRVTAEAIQTPHRQWVRAQCTEHARVLVVQDTTELDFTGRKNMRGLGPIGNNRGQGLLQHTALAITPGRELLGVLHQQWSTRINVPEGETHRQRLQRPKKTDCWAQTVAAVGPGPENTRLIHVCDREADCFEMMQACEQHACGFLIRAQHDRYVEAGTDKLWLWMSRQPVIGDRGIDLPAGNSRPRSRQALLTLRSARVSLNPPKNDPRFTHPLEVWVVYVHEPHPPKDAEPIEWMLLTSEPADTVDAAQARVDEYMVRWTIEEFHKAEKSGCRLERSQLDDAEDIKRLAAIVAVMAVRLLKLREMATAGGGSNPPAEDPAVLQRAVPWLWIVVVARANKKNQIDPATLTPREFWLRIARQGGYLGRRIDGPPGWSTIWKGWYDFAQMFRGAELMAENLAPPKCG